MAKDEPKPLVGGVDAESAVTAEKIDTVIINPAASIPAAAPPTRPTAKPPRNLPDRNRRFAGRQTELDEVHRRLQESVLIGVTQQTAAHAQGGVGKTSIAHEYAWRHLTDYPGGLFVIPCDTDLLLPAVAALAAALGMAEADTPEETADQVKALLENGPPSLLILDNVRDAGQWTDGDWSACLPTGNCRRLITTRAANLPGVDMFHIERLPRDQGIALLAKYRSDAAAAQNEGVVGDIVDWFDGLAVGLTNVGVYMKLHPQLDWEQYAESLASRGLGAVRATEEAVGKLPDYDQRVDAVFDDGLEALPPEQLRGLEYAALLPEDTVLRPWLAWLLEQDKGLKLPTPPGYEDHPAEAVVSGLLSLDLLVPAREGKNILAVHRVLRRRLHERLTDATADRDRLLDAITRLGETRGKASRDAVTRPELRPELTPLAALAGELERAGRFDAAVVLANWICTPLRDLGRYAEGRGLAELMVTRCEAEPDSIAPVQYGILLNNLALFHQDLGDLPAARRLMERAVEIGEKHLDADHPTLAIRYSNLAVIMIDVGELPEARRLMERAVEICEKHFDADDPILATRYSNLATILQALGDLPAARRLIERAVEIEEKHFDTDHPTLAISYNNLALILADMGELAAAREAKERSIEIELKHFGEDHPQLAASYSNLAMILRDIGELSEARRLTERAFEIGEKHFDTDHPELAIRFSNLAMILKDVGDLPEARRLMERAIEIGEKNFKPDHPHLALFRRNLAAIQEAEAGEAIDD